jgi:fructose-6-phosphate aldolase 1
MTKIYLDTADINEVTQLIDYLPIAGVTTNPTIAAKSGKPLSLLLPQLRQTLGHNGLLFAQVLADRAEDMVEEAKRLNAYVDNLVVKIPVNKEGLRAMKMLQSSPIRVLGTAVYNATQGLLAALAGAEFVAPYINRIDMLSGNGIETVQTLTKLLNLHAPHCQVLGASFKNSQQVIECFLANCGGVTIPSDLAKKLVANPAVDAATEQFKADWHAAYGNLSL